VTLSPEWETSFMEALSGPVDDRQLAMAPSRLAEFIHRLKATFDALAQSGEAPVLLTGSQIRFHVRAIVERIRPMTPVLAQTEIFARAKIRTLGSI
jgi:flagellar biosynthesis protein FlhA